MKQLNRYYRCAKISERKTRQIIKYFALDLTANKTALLTGITHKSVKQIYLRIRCRIAAEAERASPFSACQIEVDESYFGARRVRGKRGRGAGKSENLSRLNSIARWRKILVGTLLIILEFQ